MWRLPGTESVWSQGCLIFFWVTLQVTLRSDQITSVFCFRLCAPLSVVAIQCVCVCYMFNSRRHHKWSQLIVFEQSKILPSFIKHHHLVPVWTAPLNANYLKAAGCDWALRQTQTWWCGRAPAFFASRWQSLFPLRGISAGGTAGRFPPHPGIPSPAHTACSWLHTGQSRHPYSEPKWVQGLTWRL